MTKKTWYIVGVIVVVAATVGFYLRSKANVSDEGQSQLPAEQAEANYTVPPNIGMSVDNTGGVNFPQGQSGFTFNASQANALPSSGNGS